MLECNARVNVAVYGFAGWSLTEWHHIWPLMEGMPGRRQFSMAMLECVDDCLRHSKDTGSNQLRVCAWYLSLMLHIELFGNGTEHVDQLEVSTTLTQCRPGYMETTFVFA